MTNFVLAFLVTFAVIGLAVGFLRLYLNLPTFDRDDWDSFRDNVNSRLYSHRSRLIALEEAVGPTWTTGLGRVMRVRDMTDLHLQNAIDWCGGRGEDSSDLKEELRWRRRNQKLQDEQDRLDSLIVEEARQEFRSGNYLTDEQVRGKPQPSHTPETIGACMGTANPDVKPIDKAIAALIRAVIHKEPVTGAIEELRRIGRSEELLSGSQETYRRLIEKLIDENAWMRAELDRVRFDAKTRPVNGDKQ